MASLALPVLFPLRQCFPQSRPSLVSLLSLLSSLFLRKSIKASCSGEVPSRNFLHRLNHSHGSSDKLFRVCQQICLNGNSQRESEGRRAEAVLPESNRSNELDLLQYMVVMWLGFFHSFHSVYTFSCIYKHCFGTAVENTNHNLLTPKEENHLGL